MMEIKKPVSSAAVTSTQSDSSTETTGKTFNAKISAGVSRVGDSVETAATKQPDSNLSTSDPSALIQKVVRDSYLQSTEDLKAYADKVKYFNDTKKQLRDSLQNKFADVDQSLKEEFGRISPGDGANFLQDMITVLKASKKENNETQKYFLERLGDLIKYNKSISEYMKILSNASDSLSTKEKDDDD